VSSLVQQMLTKVVLEVRDEHEYDGPGNRILEKEGLKTGLGALASEFKAPQYR
jgi:hypothetical protein